MPVATENTACLETCDCSILRRSAAFLLGGAKVDPRQFATQSARLTQQFIRQNRPFLEDFGVSAHFHSDGIRSEVVFETGVNIGALPLFSPTTSKPVYGLVIKPRFEWQGLGPMLGEMGWKVIPAPVDLPLLPRSSRKVPQWVISTVVLFRIKDLLDGLDRRFEYSEEVLPAPRGQVNWQRYATTMVPRMQFLSVPCRFPDLRDDQDLMAAIHFTLSSHLRGLEHQRQGGVAVLRLIDLCQELLTRVAGIPPREPNPKQIAEWLHGSGALRIATFAKGIQAIEWTVEERGLAGLSDLQGLPWKMSMADFYEAWVETIAERLVRHIGGVLRVGRRRETVVPISWDKAYLGSQRSLKPDLVIERADETIVIDAKFKAHWEELSHTSWGRVDEDIRESHREDILQVLAYSTLFTTRHVTVCLAYPCRAETWESLERRDLLHRHASIHSGTRRVDLVLTAIPMIAKQDAIAKALSDAFMPWREG